MSANALDPGSYRDPAGRVYLHGGRVLRTVMPCAKDDYDFVRKTGALDTLMAAGDVVGEQQVDGEELGEAAAGASYVLEHPMIPFVSYPYEWCFYALKAAALHHLDVHLRVLDFGVTLSDATAYNVQFIGPKPIFIDSLSFRRYHPGEYWLGHRQFCEQFLNPLLLQSHVGVAHNAWYRGNLEGISTPELRRLLGFREKLSLNVLAHVVLPSSFQSSTRSRSRAVAATRKPLHATAYRRMLQGLRGWIERLEPKGMKHTTWSEYAASNSYSSKETEDKRAFVSEFVRETAPKTVWDIGCNTGEFSKAALAAGAERVIGFDFDQGALARAYQRASEESLDFLPLYLDATNPAPDQGWAQAERRGMMRRANADAVLALAVVHHLAIAKNVPLHEVCAWLVEMAPTGVIEFVPKADPMVQDMLRLREDIFPDYTPEAFQSALGRHARIVASRQVSSTGRCLYWYARDGGRSIATSVRRSESCSGSEERASPRQSHELSGLGSTTGDHRS